MIKKKLRYCAIILAGVIIAQGSLSAYQWPSQQFSLVHTFGQHSRYGVHKSVGIKARSAEVGVIIPGELVFEQGPHSVFPSKSGYTRVVAHEKEELLSVYAGLTSLHSTSDEVMPIDALVGALSAETGSDYRLYVFDLRLGQYVNPLVFLPTGFAGGVPVIAGFFLVYEDGEVVALRAGSVVRSGLAEMIVEVYSRSSLGDSLMPRTVSLRLMGDRVSDVELNAFGTEQGKTFLVGAKRIMVANLYTERGFLRLTSVRLFQGQINIVLRAANADGLGREVAMRFSVVN